MRCPADIKANLERVRALRAAGRLEEAEEIILRSIDAFPPSFEFEVESAWVAHSAKRLDLVLQRWQRVRESFPENVTGYICSALSLRALGQRRAADDVLKVAT